MTSGSDGHGGYLLMQQLDEAIDLLRELGNGVAADELYAWAENHGMQLLEHLRAEVLALNCRIGELSEGRDAARTGS